MDRAPLHIPDWLTGTEELSMDAEFVYFRLCLFIYQFDGLLKDDDRSNARRCKMSTRGYRQAKAELLAAAKIEIRDGYLWNRRCEKVLSDVCALSEAQSRRAQRRWEKAGRNGVKAAEKASEKAAMDHEKPSEFNGDAYAKGYAGDHPISEARKTRKEETSLRSASSLVRNADDDHAPATRGKSADWEDRAYDALERLLGSSDWSLRSFADKCGSGVGHGHVGKVNNNNTVPEHIRQTVLATALRLDGERNVS